MLQSEQGIVLASVRHNDRTSILKVFTRTRGMVTFVFHLGQAAKSAARNSLQQPLTQIEFQTDYRPSASLFSMREIKNLHPYRSIVFSPVKSAIALFVSEFLSHALMGEECNPKLYSFLTDSLEWFDHTPESQCANFHMAVMLGTATALGISPDTDNYEPGAMLDLREGCFTMQPEHTDCADASTSAVIARLLQCSLEETKDAPLNREQRVLTLRTLNNYFRLHIPMFPQLESIAVLEAVFS
ncbi:MAG: DNA repair protein RecO [Bacteroidaceae bacterium]|nr:DNA repair protein RecO [Bacteroidaceae bacterium]